MCPVSFAEKWMCRRQNIEYVARAHRMNQLGFQTTGLDFYRLDTVSLGINATICLYQKEVSVYFISITDKQVSSVLDQLPSITI